MQFSTWFKLAVQEKHKKEVIYLSQGRIVFLNNTAILNIISFTMFANQWPRIAQNQFYSLTNITKYKKYNIEKNITKT